VHHHPTDALTFGLLSKVSPKQNDFFREVMQGCIDAAAEEGDICVFDGPTGGDARQLVQDQADMLLNLYRNESIDGIGVAVLDEDTFDQTLKELKNRHSVRPQIPIITFDSDAPRSGRDLAVLTNNTSLGIHLGKVSLQIQPKGGNYAIISSLTGPNLAQRVEGVREKIKQSKYEWNELPGSPSNCNEDFETARQQISEFVQKSDSNPTVIISVGGWPMWSTQDNENAWIKTVASLRQNNNTLVSIIADATNEQVDLFKKGYTNGLVAQEPYQMGRMAAQKLRQLVKNQNITFKDEKIVNTHILEMIRTPINLPDVNIKLNSIQNLRPVGYFAFGLVTCLSIGFGAWTFLNRKNKVVRASQPFFLIMMCVGVFISAMVFIPMSIDDQEPFTVEDCQRACKAVIWFPSVGLTISHSALFSKLWRINKIFQSSKQLKHIKVTKRDVIVPFFSLLAANLLILTIWAIVDPDDWVRNYHTGTDEWNRPVSSYGICRRSKPFGITILALNITALFLVVYQAFKARKITTDFAESRYIGIVVLTMLNFLILVVPILFLSGDKPQVKYLIYILFGCILLMLKLLLIFIPKIIAVKRGNEEPPDSFQRFVKQSNRLHSDVMYGMNINYIDILRRSQQASQRDLSFVKEDEQQSLTEVHKSTIFNGSIIEEDSESVVEDIEMNDSNKTTIQQNTSISISFRKNIDRELDDSI